MTTVADLMTASPVTTTPETPLASVMDVFDRRRFRHLPVVDAAGVLVGVLSQRDVVKVAYGHPVVEDSVQIRVTVGELMSQNLTTASPGADAMAVARHMLQEKHGCLPVVDAEGRVVGIVTEADFVRAWMRSEGAR